MSEWRIYEPVAKERVRARQATALPDQWIVQVVDHADEVCFVDAASFTNEYRPVLDTDYLRRQLEDAQGWLDGLEAYFLYWWTQDARITDQSGLFALIGEHLREVRKVLDDDNVAGSKVESI